MKINHYAVLPSSVRHDRNLSDKSILLWAEISAAADTFGICADENSYFANILNVDVRTINRCLAQLVDNGHIVRFLDKGKRKIRVIIHAIDPPDELTGKIPEPEAMDSTIDFSNKLFTIWEDQLSITIKNKEAFYHIIHRALRIFKEEEILNAIRNRIIFLLEAQQPWLNELTPQFFATDTLKKWITTK